MKKLKRIAALLLALVMVFALCACSADGGKDKDSNKDDNKKEEVKKTDAELIVGTWESSVNFGGTLASLLDGMSDDEAELLSYVDFDSIDFYLRLEFTKDGEYVMYYEENDTLDKVHTAFRDGFEAYLTEQLQGSGYTLEDYAQEEGMSADEYLDALADVCSSSMKSVFSRDLASGTYEIEDGKLYLIGDGDEKDDDTYAVYKLSKNKLVIKETYADGEKNVEESGVLPIVTFNRVDD